MRKNTKLLLITGPSCPSGRDSGYRRKLAALLQSRCASLSAGNVARTLKAEEAASPVSTPGQASEGCELDGVSASIYGNRGRDRKPKNKNEPVKKPKGHSAAAVPACCRGAVVELTDLTVAVIASAAAPASQEEAPAAEKVVDEATQVVVLSEPSPGEAAPPSEELAVELRSEPQVSSLLAGIDNLPRQAKIQKLWFAVEKLHVGKLQMYALVLCVKTQSSDKYDDPGTAGVLRKIAELDASGVIALIRSRLYSATDAQLFMALSLIAADY